MMNKSPKVPLADFWEWMVRYLLRRSEQLARGKTPSGGRYEEYILNLLQQLLETDTFTVKIPLVIAVDFIIFIKEEKEIKVYLRIVGEDHLISLPTSIPLDSWDDIIKRLEHVRLEHVRKEGIAKFSFQGPTTFEVDFASAKTPFTLELTSLFFELEPKGGSIQIRVFDNKMFIVFSR